MDSTLSNLSKDLYRISSRDSDISSQGVAEEIEDLANVIDRFCKENAQNGVIANEALKRIVDYLLQNVLYSELPDNLIKDIRTVGLFIEGLTLECT